MKKNQPFLIISWNVAGWATTLDCITSHYESLENYLDRHKVDILCLQEVKQPRNRLSEGAQRLGAKLRGWDTFWAPCSESTFNGVATFARKGLTSAANSNPLLPNELNRHGRCIRTDHKHFIIFNVYCPAASNRLGETFRLNFLSSVRRAMKNARTETGKSVILCGDMNIAYNAEDVQWERRDLNMDLLSDPAAVIRLPGNLDEGTQRRFLACKKDIEKHWSSVREAMESFQVVEEETSNSVTNQKYDRFRAVVQVGTRRVKLGKPFHTRAEAEYSYSLGGFKWVDDVTGQEDFCYPPNHCSVSKVAELLKAVCGVQWSVGCQVSLAKVAGDSPSSLPSKKWMTDLFQADHMVDSFRAFYPRGLVHSRFTCWNQYTNARYINAGSRIDYFIVDRALCDQVARGPGLAYGAAGEQEEDRAAALRAATANGRFQAASFAGEGLAEPPVKVNDSQFCAPHTGMVYTPPKYSDHIAVSLLLDLADPFGVALDNSPTTKLAQPQLEQPSITSFFGAKKDVPSKQSLSAKAPLSSKVSGLVPSISLPVKTPSSSKVFGSTTAEPGAKHSNTVGNKPQMSKLVQKKRMTVSQPSVRSMFKKSKVEEQELEEGEVVCIGGTSNAKVNANSKRKKKSGTLQSYFTAGN